MNEQTVTKTMEKGSRPSVLELALDYAKRGFKVLPVYREDAVDADGRKKQAKSPFTAHGFKDATNDPETIAKWFKGRNDLMVAAATGKASGIWVLDIDAATKEKPDRNGFESVKKVLERAGRELPETLAVKTPSGGRHLYFKWKEGSPKTRTDIWGDSRKDGVASGVDVRGDGGYIVLPGNVRGEGEYAIEGGKDFKDIAEAPEWLERLCGNKEGMEEAKSWLVPEGTGEEQTQDAPAVPAKKKGKGRISKDPEDLAEQFVRDIIELREAPEGTRNSLLHGTACRGWRLVSSGVLEEEDVRRHLLEAMEANGDIADDGRAKTVGTIESAKREVLKELRLDKFKEPEVEGFVLTDDELARICLRSGEPVGDAISDGFRINGVGSVDGRTGWALAIDFTTTEGRQPWLFANRSLISRNTAYLELISDAGFSIQKNKSEDFIEFLGKSFKKHRNRVIRGEEEPMLFPNKTGWLEDKPYYILPNEVIPPNPKIIPNIEEMKNAYSRKGRREEWLKIAKYAVKNPPYTFGICLAVAGVLLPFSGIDTGTFFHPTNDSTAGKSLMAHIAASVWGRDKDQRVGWDATLNNVASLGCSRNHNTLVVDEIGHADPKDVGRIVYTLANGRGRGKNDQNDHAKELKTWICFILSNGEATLNAVMKEAGRGGATGGQNVRFVPIRLDKSLYGSLHGFPTGDAIVREIIFITERNYGWAGPDFVKWVAEHYEMVKRYVPEAMPKIIDALVPEGSHDQIRRTAQAFALLVIAGRFAQRCGILPEEIDVLKDIKTMCDAWLAERGSVGKSSEADSIVSNVTYNITTYPAKFMEVAKGKAVGDSSKMNELLGYKERIPLKDGDYAYHFYINDKHLARIAGYESLDAVASALDDAGMLYATPKKKKAKSRDKRVQRNFDGVKMDRYYEIMLHEGIECTDYVDCDEPEAVEKVDPETGEVTMVSKPSAEGTARAS